jgi:antiviral helicase SKI2
MRQEGVMNTADDDTITDEGFEGQATDIDELLPISVSHSCTPSAPSLADGGQRTNLKPISAVTRAVRRPQVQKRDWAHVVDINKPMKNFYELVPDMAHKVIAIDFEAPNAH